MEPSTFDQLPFVDSHLDLAENVTLFGRDLTLYVAETRRSERRKWGQGFVWDISHLAEEGVWQGVDL